tara:strand:- start:252 stop:497 length:246 start_codon:yes stop_codon:yes gene_type:complete
MGKVTFKEDRKPTKNGNSSETEEKMDIPNEEETWSKEQYEEQIKYAQKLLQVLQTKLNEANGVNIQLEAKLQIAEEKLKEG